MTTTQERQAPEDVVPLTPREFGRWVWRQLTSMRTALILLFMLALGSVPGSVVPQEAVDSLRASQWKTAHPELSRIYEKLGLFSVYSSVWFSAIYILLMISLIGCILPRCKVYFDALRARPPKAPRRLDRLAAHGSFTTDASVAEVLEATRRRLGRYRVRTDDESPGAVSVAAERGYLREAGNLLFHISVMVVLVGFAMGSMLGFKGGVIVVQGTGFANSLSQYDDFVPGKLFDPSTLAPFSFEVSDFKTKFIRAGRAAGMAHEFSMAVAYRTSPQAPLRHTTVSVNHPLNVDGTKVYLISHGYAPHITVRDGTGATVFSGPVVFLPEDASFRSFGVVKVPDATARDGRPEQLGFEGELYPTYAFTMQTGPFSAYPEATDPLISMTAWTGDLGMDNGLPQSVYALDKKGLVPLRNAGKQVRVDLPMGKTEQLPDGRGSITFDSISPFVKLQVSRSPFDWLTLLGVSLALLGLLGSLFIRPRRVWVRARREGGRTLVEVAGLDRSSGGDLGSEVDALVERLHADTDRPGGEA